MNSRGSKKRETEKKSKVTASTETKISNYVNTQREKMNDRIFEYLDKAIADETRDLQYYAPFGEEVDYENDRITDYEKTVEDDVKLISAFLQNCHDS